MNLKLFIPHDSERNFSHYGLIEGQINSKVGHNAVYTRSRNEKLYLKLIEKIKFLVLTIDIALI